eukprot:scaffold23183_cov31-Tisochrysis_lutea.AAC.3
MSGHPYARSVGLTPGTTEEKRRQGIASLTENWERPLARACDITPVLACRAEYVSMNQPSGGAAQPLPPPFLRVTHGTHECHLSRPIKGRGATSPSTARQRRWQPHTILPAGWP